MSQHDPAQTPVAFLGLGVMGGPMAGHLAKAGYPVTVYNRTASKAEAWAAEHGGQHAATPAAAVQGAAIAFSCVGNDDDLRSITLGDDGAFAAMAADSIFVDIGSGYGKAVVHTALLGGKRASNPRSYRMPSI